jgi:hypothetical protein
VGAVCVVAMGPGRYHFQCYRPLVGPFPNSDTKSLIDLSDLSSLNARIQRAPAFHRMPKIASKGTSLALDAAFQTSSSRSSRPTAIAALRSVFNVTAS